MATYSSEPTPGIAREAFWLNPWEYGTNDLLTPLVLSILARMPRDFVNSKPALKEAAITIGRAGLSIGLKAASIFLPGGGLIGVAAEPVDKLIEGLFKAEDTDDSGEPDSDPVAAMARRFCQLIQEYKSQKNFDPAYRVLICVDDLDSVCLIPQVAMLEAHQTKRRMQIKQISSRCDCPAAKASISATMASPMPATDAGA